MKRFHAAIVLGLGAVMMGCAGNAVEDERTEKSEDALGLAAKPPAKDRRVIRSKTPGCNTVVGVGGSWGGEALHGPFGTSDLFCTYTWTPAGKNAQSDTTALAAAAMVDPKRNAPYVVNDVRTTNGALGAGSLSAQDTFTFNPGGGSSSSGGSSSGGVFVNNNNFLFGGSTPQNGSGGVGGITIATPTDPTGVPQCEICGGPAGDYNLLFVLPPDALQATSITLTTSSGTYNVGAATAPVFYTPLPPTFSYNNWLVSWAF